MYSIKELSYPEWQELINICRKTNMLQFWQYGDAKAKISTWKPIRFLVTNEEGDPIALIQALSLNFSFFGGIVRVNRGPLIIGESINSQELLKTFSTLFNEFKKRRWFLIQIAPEVDNKDLFNEFLINFGLKKLSSFPFASGLLSLLPSNDELLMGLKKKWRYSLRKAENSNITISKIEANSKNLEILLNRYKELKVENDFVGIADSLILSLSKQKESKEWQFNIFIANDNNSVNIENCYGILVSIRHGDTTTYLIGISGKDGREFQVNYLLLWKSILHAKINGCDWFDIGGLDSSTPMGIAHFKNGVKSEPYSLNGEWRGFLFPWTSIK